MLPLLFGLVLLGILTLYFLLESWRRRALGRPMLAMAVAVAGSAGLAFAGHFLLGLVRAGDYWRAYPIVATTAVYACALAACAAALLLVARTAERTRLRAAFWLFLTVLGGAICFVAPGGRIFFLAPPFAAALGMAETLVAPCRADRRHRCRGPALPHLRPRAGPVRGADEQHPPWIFATLGGGDPAAGLDRIAAVAVGLRPFWVVAGAIDIGVTAWLVAAFTPAYSADRQQLFTIEYVWDETARTGRFAVNNDGAPVPFAGDWQRTQFPYTSRRRWAARAPAAPVAGPRGAGEPRGGAGWDRVRLRLR